MVLINLRSYFGSFTEGRLLRRINRFVVLVEVNGKERRAHLSDTGRLGELLKEGAPVLLAPNPRGKLDYKFVAVKSGLEWVLLNTSVHSLIARRIIEEGLLGFKPKELRPEFRFGRSRIDFLIDGNLLLEVKGCNLVRGEICLFPDAPTERGRHHLEELVSAVKRGYRGALLFLAFRSCRSFLPNRETDPQFAEALESAIREGVELFVVRLSFLPSGEVVFRESLTPNP